MKIGKKLKEARIKSKLTQEQVAEQLLVSRQTVSNWENEKSYPDIISAVKLSDLYSVSLDELLKGDVKMLEYLETSTDIVKSNRKLTGAIILNILLLAFLLIMAGFFPNSAYMIACVFCIAIISTSYLLYQIVKKI